MSPKEIAEKRRSLNISQDKLSEKLGVDPTTVYRWEAGVVAPNLANTQRLIEIFSRSEVTLSHFDKLLLEQNTPVAIIDLSCTYLAANIKFSNLIGQSKDEIVDLHVRELFSKMLRGVVENIDDRIEMHIRHRKQSFDILTKYHQATGGTLKHRFQLMSQKGYVSKYIHEITHAAS